MIKAIKDLCTLPRGFQGLWKGHVSEWLVEVSSSGFMTHKRSHRGPVWCGLGSEQLWGPWRLNPCLLRLAFGAWNVLSLVGKELELVEGVKRYIWAHSTLSTKNKPFERGWTLFYAGVARGKRWKAGVILLVPGSLPLHWC